MSIFDRLKNVAEKTAKDAARSVGNTIGTKRETFTFSALPESLAEMQALPEAKLDTPFATAALTVLALCAYAADRSTGTEMLNWLRGPRPLNGQDISFLNDRFRDGKTYLSPVHLFCRLNSGQQLHSGTTLQSHNRKQSCFG